MRMGLKEKIKCYALLTGHLILGLIFLLLIQSSGIPAGINPAIIIFLVFLLLNFGYARIFRLKTDLRQFWMSGIIRNLAAGFLAGTLISVMPVIVALISGQAALQDVELKEFSFSSLLLTFFITGWEELWFRGIILNYCHKSLSALAISITMGTLFMLMHSLNPKIDLLKTGPALFFAGALLTVLYFYYKSIWAPLGLHFGNNYVSGLTDTGMKTDLWFGEDAYVSALILALLFFVFAIKIKNRFLPMKA